MQIGLLLIPPVWFMGCIEKIQTEVKQHAHKKYPEKVKKTKDGWNGS